MARYQIVLAYDGSDFQGSQRQAARGRRGGRTVQGELEAALRTLGWQGKSVLLAGRTDRGVHASGQVAAFDLDWRHDAWTLQKALNALLPVDMAVTQVSEAPPDFHPRFWAVARRYRYRLFCAETRAPLRERYAWRVWPPVGDLRPLASLWPGTHNFAAFGSAPRPGGHTLRTVLAAQWEQQGDEWTFEIEADAFLYRMVRRLVYTQVAAGQGRLTREALANALQKQTPLPAGLAPPNGLTLVAVRYK